MSTELLELIHRINVSKYSQSDPKQILLTMMEEIRMKTGHYGHRSWEIMIEYIAKWLVLNNKVGLACMKPLQGFKGLNLEKDKLYEYLEGLDYFQHYYTAAMETPWDYIGDIFVEQELAGKQNRSGQVLTPRPIIEFMIRVVGIGEKKQRPRPDIITHAWLSIESLAYDHKLDKNLFLEQQRLRQISEIEPVWTKYLIKLQTVIDPAGVGTGRFLLVASWYAPKAPLVLFGIEIDLALYRACLVNMAMFSNHPYSIVCGDALMIDNRHGSPTSKLWDLGNQWDPPEISAFYWKPQPPPPINPKSFSLKYFSEEVNNNKNIP